MQPFRGVGTPRPNFDPRRAKRQATKSAGLIAVVAVFFAAALYGLFGVATGFLLMVTLGAFDVSISFGQAVLATASTFWFLMFVRAVFRG